DIPQRRQHPTGTTGLAQALQRLREHPVAAPVDPLERRRARAGEAEKHVAAVLRRDYDGIVTAKLRARGPQVLGAQRGAVRAYDEQRAVGGKHPVVRMPQPLAEARAALALERKPVRRAACGEEWMPYARRAPQRNGSGFR